MNEAPFIETRTDLLARAQVLLNTEVARISGDESVREVELANKQTGERRVIGVPALFSFIGATPRSDWLPDTIERDEKQFVRTGPDLMQSGRWTEPRPPCVLRRCAAIFLLRCYFRRRSARRCRYSAASVRRSAAMLDSTKPPMMGETVPS